jgi:hypothetical protein
MRSPTNRPMAQLFPAPSPAPISVPRPLYPNRLISRLRSKSWYVVPTGPEYLYYQIAWNPAMRWHFRDVQADIKMIGAMASVIMNDEIKGYCIVFCQSVTVPPTYRVKEIGVEYDPRKTY